MIVAARVTDPGRGDRLGWRVGRRGARVAVPHGEVHTLLTRVCRAPAAPST